jgi:hypothetical protein
MTSVNMFQVILSNKCLTVFNKDYSNSAFLDSKQRPLYSCNNNDNNNGGTMGEQDANIGSNNSASNGLYVSIFDKGNGALKERLFVHHLDDMEQTAQLILMLAKKSEEELMCIIAKGKWFTRDHLKLYHVLADHLQRMLHYKMEQWADEPEQPLMAIYDFDSRMVVSEVKHCSESDNIAIEFLFVEHLGRKIPSSQQRMINELQELTRSLEKQLEKSEPIGTIRLFAGKTIPEHWLVCNGQELERSRYEKLYNAIALPFRLSDSTFKLPNLSIQENGTCSSSSATVSSVETPVSAAHVSPHLFAIGNGICYIIRAE